MRPEVVAAALELRKRLHRSRNGRLSDPMRWVDVAAELERSGYGKWAPMAIARECRERAGG